MLLLSQFFEKAGLLTLDALGPGSVLVNEVLQRRNRTLLIWWDERVVVRRTKGLRPTMGCGKPVS